MSGTGMDTSVSLGLPDRRDNPDVLIDRLFVEPLLTRRHVSPDENPSNWIDEAETVFDALATGKPLVLLGRSRNGKVDFAELPRLAARAPDIANLDPANGHLVVAGPDGASGVASSRCEELQLDCWIPSSTTP